MCIFHLSCSACQIRMEGWKTLVAWLPFRSNSSRIYTDVFYRRCCMGSYGERQQRARTIKKSLLPISWCLHFWNATKFIIILRLIIFWNKKINLQKKTKNSFLNEKITFCCRLQRCNFLTRSTNLKNPNARDIRISRQISNQHVA